MASIEEFKGVAGSKKGNARSNLYSVSLPSLAGVTGSDLNILCSNVTLPGRQLTTYDKNIGTKFEKVAYGSVTDDVEMTFYAMNDYGPKKYFDEWQRLAYDAENFQIGYKSDYTRQIRINQLSKGYSTAFDLRRLAANVSDVFGRFNSSITVSTPDQVIYSCTLYHAFPVAVNSIPLSGELDGIVQVTATFSYSKWITNDIETSRQRPRVQLNLPNPLEIITRIFD
jgi:hypothetical protein